MLEHNMQRAEQTLNTGTLSPKSCHDWRDSGNPEAIAN